MTTATVHGGTALASLARPGEYVERTYSPPAMLTGPSLNYDIMDTRHSGRTIKKFTGRVDKLYELHGQI